MHRPPPPCPHRPPCPGCPRFAQRGPSPDTLAPLEALSESVGISLDVLDGDPWGYRHRVRLAVRGRKNSPKVGIFEEGTHRVVDVPSCAIHHPLINRVAAALKRAMRAAGVAPYSDAPHQGLIRSLQVVVERPSQTAQVVVVANSDHHQQLAPLCTALADELGDDLQGLFYNGNNARTNTILGPSWQRMAGAETTRETVGGASVFYPPGAFGQSNPDLADRMVEQIHAWVPDDRLVGELYAGVGAIGLGLAARCRSLAFNEMSPGSVAGLELGVAALPANLRTRVAVLPSAASDAVSSLGDAQVLIADPPRKGLGPEVVQHLVDRSREVFIYASCSVPTFLRDARSLLDSGRWRLAALQCYVLLPFTERLETLGLFVASNG